MNTARQPKGHRSLRRTLLSIADVISGAGACAAAAESGRTPNRHALKAVGIDADTWNRIGKL